MPLTTVCNLEVTATRVGGGAAGDRRARGPSRVPFFCGRRASRLGGTGPPEPAGGDDPASLSVRMCVLFLRIVHR